MLTKTKGQARGDGEGQLFGIEPELMGQPINTVTRDLREVETVHCDHQPAYTTETVSADRLKAEVIGTTPFPISDKTTYLPPVSSSSPVPTSVNSAVAA